MTLISSATQQSIKIDAPAHKDSNTSKLRKPLVVRSTLASTLRSAATTVSPSSTASSPKSGSTSSSLLTKRSTSMSTLRVQKTPTSAIRPTTTALKPLGTIEDDANDIRKRIQVLEATVFARNQATKDCSTRLLNARQASDTGTSTYKKEVQACMEEIGRLKKENEDRYDEIESLKRDADEMQARYNSKALELQISDKNYRELSREHRSLKLKLDELRDRSECIAALLNDERSQVTHLKNELLIATLERDAAKTRLREQETKLRQLHNEVLELKGNIRVFARLRPTLSDEGHYAVTCTGEQTLVVMRPTLNLSSKPIPVEFKFDRVLSAEASQECVFEEVEQLVVSALDGYNVCIFAYGQTGSGKTYTMEGPPELTFGDHSQKQHVGIIPRSVQRIFELTQERQDSGWQYSLEASFLEIYNETIRDLQSDDNGGPAKECVLRQLPAPRNGDQIFVENLRTVNVQSVEQVADLMERARRNRSVAATKCNERSSRSHSVFQLHIKASNPIEKLERESKLNLIDLAGSERIKQSGASADSVRLAEAKNINLSLTQLSIVLTCLGNKAAHIPYRNSKLTHLLSSSLAGNSKTLMLVNVSSEGCHVAETLNSLKFAQKVNEVHIGTARRNTDVRITAKTTSAVDED